MKRLTLAIETAIGGGSLSIADGAREIDFWIGNREISKAEEVLENIEKLLKKNDLTKSEIATVAVSAETGSITGLKIGLATAKGLAKSLDGELRSVPLIGALKKSIAFEGANGAAVALPNGKNNIHLQNFSNSGVETSFATISPDAFLELLRNSDETEIYAYQSVFELAIQHTQKVHNLGGNLAKYLHLEIASDNE